MLVDCEDGTSASIKNNKSDTTANQHDTAFYWDSTVNVYIVEQDWGGSLNDYFPALWKNGERQYLGIEGGNSTHPAHSASLSMYQTRTCILQVSII
jgi:hypothetical protein